MWYASCMQIERTDHFIRSLDIEAYRVGGSVRDQVMDRPAKDADYMVRGVSLRDLGKLLSGRNIAVSPLKLRDGRQAGWRIQKRGIYAEIVLPRTEVSTGPGHRDFKIEVDPNLSLEEDAKRRDFTFNALYYPMRPEPGSIELFRDPLGGMEDIRRKRINVTHADSFRDDPLRILRALRFISTLGFELGTETRALMALHAEHTTGLTAAGTSGTVIAELVKLLMGFNVGDALRVARDTGVMAVAFPELAPMLGFDQASQYHDLTTDEHTFKALTTAAHVDSPLRVRMALLFHDAGKPAAVWVGDDGRKHYYARDEEGVDHEVEGEVIWRAFARRLNVERTLREDVATLIRNHMVPADKASSVRARRERVRLGDTMYHDLLLMRACDVCAKGEPDMEKLRVLEMQEAFRKEAQDNGVPATRRDLSIGGHDLIKMGVPGGAVMGEILDQVLDEVAVRGYPVPSTLWQATRARKLWKKMSNG